MKKLLLVLIYLMPQTVALCQNGSIPHLEKQGDVTQLIVDGKPFLILGGELHNSSTSGAAYMRPIWQDMKKKNLNTVIAPVYWEMLEPAEGKFDFSLVDSMITGAKNQHLKLVILWFGTWKNGYSMYAPGWVKKDFARFPRAKSKSGESYEMLSAFSEASMKADAKAFQMLMTHIRSTDAKSQTVIAAQIENEMGLFYAARDYSDVANEAYKKGVPADLMKYLAANKSTIQPEIDSAWKANGYKTTGSWEDVFGKSTFNAKDWKELSYLPEELFTSYHYAKYAGSVAAAGKAAYPIPMYVNAWIKQPGMPYPGKYPSGGPVPHTLDIWRAVATAIDFISPDVYVPHQAAKEAIERYNRRGNLLFNPEFRPGLQSAMEAFWIYGDQNAVCFSPFGIDESTPEDDPITKTYAVLAQAKDLILKERGKGTMKGFYLDKQSPDTSISLGGYNIRISMGGGAFGDTKNSPTVAGGILINTSPDEFIVIGKDFTCKFAPLSPDTEKPLIDIEFMDEGTFINGKWVTTRRLNGDEGTGGGDYGFGFGNNKVGVMRFQKQPDGRSNVIRFKMYRYK
ncbi:MAG TPA: DUF5597 domain-containing protein [Mucilaginibacter sp.]|jgi:hypothetical protein